MLGYLFLLRRNLCNQDKRLLLNVDTALGTTALDAFVRR